MHTPEPPRLIRTAELRADGWTTREVRAAVALGRLIRMRQGAYAVEGTDPDCVDAGRLLGRLTGCSELRRRGVFVLGSDRLQVHAPPATSRIGTLARPYRLHRRELLRAPHPASLVVEPLDAVYDAVLAQPPRAAVASIDSALRAGVLRNDELDELFTALPGRLRGLRSLVDPRAESGAETLMRLILRSLGCAFEAQVVLPGVGRVDFLVEGWLVVECDSQAHHASWEAQRADRRRDLAAAALGLVTLRVIAEDIFWRPDAVRSALAGARASRFHGRRRLAASQPRATPIRHGIGTDRRGSTVRNR